MEQIRLRHDLQLVLEQFSKIKVDYCNCKINLKARDEIVEIQKNKMEAAHRRLEILATSIENYKKKYQDTLLKLQGENYQLTQKIEELEDTIRIIQQNNQSLIIEGNSCDNRRVESLEEEVQILESRLAAEEEQHREEIQKLKDEYEQRISEQLKMAEELQTKIKKLSEQALAQKPFVHPALYEGASKLKNHPAPRKKPSNSTFNWPSLDVEKIPKTPGPTPPPKKKKKKLFHADDEIVNVV
uniref:ApsB_1 protein n=1 Tax=Fopius arisanus TaxID=64838 RepID=A0A0C9RWH9_9HYME